MNDRNDTELRSIFDRAARRPQPRAEAREAAFAALRGEWQELTKRRRRRRIAGAFAVAASLALAIGGTVLLRDTTTAMGAPVATVARVEGPAVSWRAENSRSQPLTAAVAVLHVGQQLATGPGSRVALAWHGGGSLRLDENTRVEFASASSVRLTAGGLYFDSGAGDAQAAASAPALTIRTPAGDVLHLGTQFMLRVMGDELVLSVREGSVKLTGDAFDLRVDSGEEIDLDAAGVRARQPIASYADAWSWTHDIAPRERLDDRSALEILNWIARETGRRVLYGSPAVEALARRTIVRGLGDRSPADALIVLPPLTDLTVEVRDDALVISPR